MEITKDIFSSMLLNASDLLVKESEHLSQIDSRFGDGDHGVTIKKIALTIEKAVQCWQQQSFKDFIDELGTTIMGIGGGSAGPLWGTMIGGLALPLKEEISFIEPQTLKAMLSTALEEMESISTARVGDKTMMDVLIPAVQAAQKASDDVIEILEKASIAAVQGAKDTENYIAKFGRAKNYKEQTIGTPDAGAISLMVFFQGLELGAKSSLPG
ncbi:MAG: dihydroxyacetone kinase subunit L [Anaerolineales bacterium]|jgi:dihydroxyacetone kinase-like protein|nr:dihydroxyacetone kinase subunit L [Anaerolineales bacterium]